jgi:hypothetical protein
MIAAFAPGFMRISVFGDVNVGLCFGVLQFVSTFAIAVSYTRAAGPSPAGRTASRSRRLSVGRFIPRHRGHHRHLRV